MIGISGVARSGKDYLCSLLISEFVKRNIPAKRFALADPLKEEMANFIYEKFEIDIHDCSSEEKEMVRPLLVAHGYVRRKASNGKYFIDNCKKRIAWNTKTNIIPIITDIRYAEYDYDEVDWIKEHGILIHLTNRLPDGTVIMPPNEDEKINDPKIKSRADFVVEWDQYDNTDYHKWCAKNLVDELLKCPAIEHFNILTKLFGYNG